MPASTATRRACREDQMGAQADHVRPSAHRPTTPMPGRHVTEGGGEAGQVGAVARR